MQILYNVIGCLVNLTFARHKQISVNYTSIKKNSVSSALTRYTFTIVNLVNLNKK